MGVISRGDACLFSHGVCISMLTMKDVVLDNGQKLAVSRSHLEMVQKQYVTGLERFVNGYFV